MVKKKTRSKPRLVKGARTRELIKKAVLDLSLEKNWDAITIDDICAATGLTVGAFYYHFPSKDDVVAEIAADFLTKRYETVVEQLDTSAGLFEVYCNVIGSLYSSFLRDPMLCRLTAVVAQRQPSTREQWLELSAPLVAKLVSAAEGAGNTKPVSGPSADFTAIWLLTSLDDYFWRSYGEKKKKSSKKAAALEQKKFVQDLATLWYRASLGADP